MTDLYAHLTPVVIQTHPGYSNHLDCLLTSLHGDPTRIIIVYSDMNSNQKFVDDKGHTIIHVTHNYWEYSSYIAINEFMPNTFSHFFMMHDTCIVQDSNIFWSRINSISPVHSDWDFMYPSSIHNFNIGFASAPMIRAFGSFLRSEIPFDKIRGVLIETTQIKYTFICKHMFDENPLVHKVKIFGRLRKRFTFPSFSFIKHHGIGPRALCGYNKSFKVNWKHHVCKMNKIRATTPLPMSYIVIGNSTKIIGSTLGHVIDSFHNVVRLNRFELSEELNQSIGSKTTLNVVCDEHKKVTLRKQPWEHLIYDPHFQLKRPCYKNLRIPKQFVDFILQKYEIRKKLSTGLMTILYILHYKNIPYIHFTNFNIGQTLKDTGMLPVKNDYFGSAKISLNHDWLFEFDILTRLMNEGRLIELVPN